MGCENCGPIDYSASEYKNIRCQKKIDKTCTDVDVIKIAEEIGD